MRSDEQKKWLNGNKFFAQKWGKMSGTMAHRKPMLLPEWHNGQMASYRNNLNVKMNDPMSDPNRAVGIFFCLYGFCGKHINDGCDHQLVSNFTDTH